MFSALSHGYHCKDLKTLHNSPILWKLNPSSSATIVSIRHSAFIYKRLSGAVQGRGSHMNGNIWSLISLELSLHLPVLAYNSERMKKW